MMITAPLLMPIAAEFDWNGIWFSIIVLVTLQIGNISPPFGMSLSLCGYSTVDSDAGALSSSNSLDRLRPVSGYYPAMFPWLVLVIPSLILTLTSAVYRMVVIFAVNHLRAHRGSHC